MQDILHLKKKQQQSLDWNFTLLLTSQAHSTYKIICKYEHNVWPLMLLARHTAMAGDHSNEETKMDWKCHYSSLKHKEYSCGRPYE